MQSSMKFVSLAWAMKENRLGTSPTLKAVVLKVLNLFHYLLNVSLWTGVSCQQTCGRTLPRQGETEASERLRYLVYVHLAGEGYSYT